jgi:phenylacetate-CoA ligase
MNTDILRSVVKKHPVLEQVVRQLIAGVPLSRRLGRGFWEWYAFYQQSESWTRDELLEFQFDTLRGLLRELRLSSPFYRERLSGVDIDAIHTIDDLKASIPVLTRDEFRRNYAHIRATDWRQRRLESSRTSGTTGSALQFYHAAADRMREIGAVYSLWRQVGYVPGKSRRAEFRGLTDAGQLVKRYPEQGMIRCSILHLEREHVRHYAEEIDRAGIEFFHGYPSAIYLLARDVLRSGRQFPQPLAMLFHSEQVYDWQVDAIRCAFPSTRLMSVYGCAERTVLGAWCEHSRQYHMVPQYSIVEVDRATREIIGTNLFNSVNGFIRYAMSDTALECDDTPCPACQRPYTPVLSQLGGRSEDYLHSVEYGWIPPAIVTYPLKALRAVHEVQLYQSVAEEVVVRFTVCAEATPEAVDQELDQIREGFLRILGPRTRCTFEQAPSFARTSSGKFKWIVCELSESRHGVNPTMAA